MWPPPKKCWTWPSGLGRLPAMTALMEPHIYDGPHYVPERDNARLKTQTARIFHYMLDGEWHTFDDIHAATGAPSTSINSQFGHIRHKKFGEHTVDSRKRPESDGLFEYKLIPNGPLLDGKRDGAPSKITLERAVARTAITFVNDPSREATDAFLAAVRELETEYPPA